MSLDTALARISQLQTAFAPPAPPPAQAPVAPPGGAGAATPFAGALEQAMGAQGGSASAASPGGPAATGGAQAPAGRYPHLTGDLDASPEILKRLEALAASRGQKFHVTSGLRTHAEQQRLWDNRHSNPNPVARPGQSNHHSGTAADVSIGGRPIQHVIGAAELRRFGLHPLAGDPPHVELPR